jgi:ABC-2 type transport system permease protein
MNDLINMIRVELHKAVKSQVPWLTGFGFLILPVMSSFLFFIYKNPDLSRQLGLIGTKANIVIGEVNWPAYLKIVKEVYAMGGFFIICMMISWVFGREFTDHTVKDILAVPIPRIDVLMGKLATVAIWYGIVVVVSCPISLLMGMALQLPGGTPALLLHESLNLLTIALFNILVMTPFAFLASLGRGFLLPFGIAIVTMILDNLLAVIGYADYFPWAIPGIFSQGIPVSSGSVATVWITALLGILITYLWWMHADQSR